MGLTILPGEIHGLVGQNGSGKSTLIKILTGYHEPDSGLEYRVDGQSMNLPVRWREVHAAGVSVVHQDLGLLDDLSVAENICVGGYPATRLGRIDRAQRDQLARRLGSGVGLDTGPGAMVGTLDAPQRAAVAIARAMRDHLPGSGLIILDEATRALSGEALASLHRLLRRIVTKGSSVLMVSHSLPEVLSVTDRITILRDGRLTGSGLITAEISEQEVARRMLGKDIADLKPREASNERGNQSAASVIGLSGKRVRDVCFEVQRGEILGITGLPGSGYEEIPYLISGARRALRGTLRTDSRSIDLAHATVRECMRAGVALVPERRAHEGLALEMNVQENISLPALRRRGRPWFVAKRWQREEAARATKALDIRPRSPSFLIKQLSGGNQQKVLLSKWLGLNPTLLVLAEPTQGVDVGARQDILRAVHHAADGGMAVILVTSEPTDLVAACDRLLIYTVGRGLEGAHSLDSDAIIEQIYAETSDAATDASR